MKIPNPTLSVITPCLNPGEVIRRAVESVRMQEYPHVEHIVVDGGSTDGTAAWLKQASGVRWVSEPDSGQADAMNKGFRLSTGEVVVYLNADDHFLPGAFAAVAAEFAAGHKIVMGDVLVKQHRDNSEWLNTPKSDFGSMLRHWEDQAFCVNPVGYFYLREVQEAVPFNLENRYTMDLEFLLNVSLKYPIRKIARTLGIFEYAADCKTGRVQSWPSYWNPESWPYIERLANEHVPDGERALFFRRRDWGYQRRRQLTAETLLGTDAFEELVESGEIIPLPTADACAMNSGCAKDHSRVIPFNSMAVRGDMAVNILQPGEMESQALCVSLREEARKERTTRHIFQSRFTHSATINDQIRETNCAHSHFYSALAQCIHKTRKRLFWKFITVVRDPLSIALDELMYRRDANASGSDGQKAAEDKYAELKDAMRWVVMTRILPFFDLNYREALNIDVYSKPFPKDAGWDIQHYPAAEVLIFRFEDLNSCYPQAMRECLGLTDMVLPRVNAIKDRTINDLKKKAERRMGFDSAFIDTVYQHPFVTHFYTAGEIAAMRVKWGEKGRNVLSVPKNQTALAVTAMARNHL